MRLKEVFIRRYGPISGLHLRLASGLQPIYGLNESGKTLVIDALVKRLIGLEVGSDPLLDRVEETPEGYIVLEDKGQEMKLGENETLATYLAIEPDELRNVFVVRDADLRIASEDIFYNRVTDKITGLRLEDIRKIKEQLRDSGKLTEGLKISDTATHSKAKSQLELAEKLKNDVEQYIEKAKSEHLEKLEADVFEANIRKSQLESHLELLEKTKKKTDFQKLKDELESAQSSLSELNKIPEEAFQSLGKKLTLYEVSENKLPHFSRAREFFQKLSYLLSIGSFAAFVSLSLLQKLDAISLIIPSILLILTAISITQWLKASHDLSEAEQNRASLLREATTAGLEIKDISSLRKSLNESDAAIRRLGDDLNQKLGVLKKDLKIELDIPQDILKKSAEKLDVIKGEIDQSVNIGYSQEDYKQTRSELAKLEERLKNVGEALEKHLRTIEDLASRANKLEFPAFLNRELDLQVKNLDSLKQLIPQLDELKAKIIEDVQLGMDSLKLFDILEEEEKAKVASLFKEGNLASQLFSKTTNGRYSEVKYDHEKEEIIVTRPTGETFQAQKLSKGTRDQLYFSIRVALGQMLLEGANGFFITDDAFVSSDDKRIKQQIDLLKTISEMGWQIIYFSAKKGAIDMLSKVTQNKIITLQPLP
jgi:chromosome segregation ATPase